MGMLLRRHYKPAETEQAEMTVSTGAVDLSEMTVKQLKAMAKEKGVEGYSGLDKEALIEALKEG